MRAMSEIGRSRRPAEPESLSRTLRCPKCRQTFETMRRWRMACPECGHEWEEATVLTTGDKVSNVTSQIGEYVFMAVGWGVVLLFCAAVIAIFVIGAVRATERGGLANGLVVVAVFLILTIGIAGFTRRNQESGARVTWWNPGWRNRDRK
jgi:hypothetical protein